MRLLISLGVGLLLSALFLGIAFASDGAGGVWHQLRNVFIGPPLWLLQTALPAISQSFAIRPGSAYSSPSFFMLFFLLFWWLACSVLVFSIRNQLHKISFKPDSLRESA